MATFYNRQGDKVEVTIEGFTDYEVTACQITSDDISENIFCNIYTSALSLSLYTSNDAIYTGSLIGNKVTLKITKAQQVERASNIEVRQFTIVTNVADMDANYAREIVQVEAIDNLTLYKNERYEARGFKKVSEILTEILGGCAILSAWGGTDIKDIKINIDALYEDEGNTAPLKYDVLQVVCEFCNRSLYYNYIEDMYVLFAVNSHSKEGVYVDAEDEVGITLVYHDTTYTINANTICATDRRISLEDVWQSAMITAQFEDAESISEAPSYTGIKDEGELEIYGDNYAKYITYWGTSEGQRRYHIDSTSIVAVEDDSIEDQTIDNTMQDVEEETTAIAKRYHHGGRMITQASGVEDETGDVEGYATTEEYYLFWGNKNSAMGVYPSYVQHIETSQIVTEDLYLVLGGSVLFSRFPVPLDEGKKQFANAIKWLRRFDIKLTYTDGEYSSLTIYAPLVKDSTKEVTLGQKYSIVNNVYWRHSVDTNGYIVSLCNNTLASGVNRNKGKIISSIDISMYGGMRWATNAVPNIISEYEFVSLDVNIAHASNINTEIISTDTIYKWVNDNESAVICSGNEYSNTPKIVTYDNKLAGNNCALYGDGYLTELSDEKHYTGAKISSENRRIYDMSVQYADNTFTENVSVYGLLWFNNIFKDAYYSKNAVATSLTLDVVEATTNVTIKELKEWA